MWEVHLMENAVRKMEYESSQSVVPWILTLFSGIILNVYFE